MESFIHPSAVLAGNVSIGRGVYIGPNCLIGFPAEYKDGFPHDSEYGVEILDGAKITGNVTIDAGTKQNTVIGEYSFLMKGVHIGHDVYVGNDVTISPHDCIGGHVKIGDKSNFGMGCIIHPRQKIGAYAMIGMGAIVPKRLILKPGHIYVGNPAREIGINSIGLERAGIDMSKLDALIEEFLSEN